MFRYGNYGSKIVQAIKKMIMEIIFKISKLTARILGYSHNSEATVCAMLHDYEWKRAEYLIDTLLYFYEEDHCKNSYIRMKTLDEKIIKR